MKNRNLFSFILLFFVSCQTENAELEKWKNTQQQILSENAEWALWVAKENLYQIEQEVYEKQPFLDSLRYKYAQASDALNSIRTQPSFEQKSVEFIQFIKKNSWLPFYFYSSNSKDSAQQQDCEKIKNLAKCLENSKLDKSENKFWVNQSALFLTQIYTQLIASTWSLASRFSISSHTQLVAFPNTQPKLGEDFQLSIFYGNLATGEYEIVVNQQVVAKNQDSIAVLNIRPNDTLPQTVNIIMNGINGATGERYSAARKFVYKAIK